MFPVAIAIATALAGFIAGIIYRDRILSAETAIKLHVTAELAAAREEIANLRAELKGFVEHIAQKL
jgi:hypothetical protein